MTAANDFPALEGRTVTEGHARICIERGHARHAIDGVVQGGCPRCGEARETVHHSSGTVVDVFAGRPEARTSYDNQRQLARRDLPAGVACMHDVRLTTGCPSCRRSGSVLVWSDVVVSA